MTVLWPITRPDRTETTNGQSQATVHIPANSAGGLNTESGADSQTYYTAVQFGCGAGEKKAVFGNDVRSHLGLS